MHESGKSVALDETKQNTLCALISVGCSRRHAARYVGCSASTIRNTAERDQQFAERLRTAEMRREFTPLHRMLEHSQRSWRAAAWLLERNYPGRYGKWNPELVTRGEVADVMQLIVGAFDDDAEGNPATLESILARLEALMQKTEPERPLDPDEIDDLRRPGDELGVPQKPKYRSMIPDSEERVDEGPQRR